MKYNECNKIVRNEFVQLIPLLTSQYHCLPIDGIAVAEAPFSLDITDPAEAVILPLPSFLVIPRELMLGSMMLSSITQA